MSQKVQGVVYRVYEKQFPPKGGKPGNTWFSIKLEDDKVYYRCKADRYAGIAESGKLISLEHNGVSEDGSQAEVVKGSVKALAVPSQQAGTAALAAGAAIGAQGSTGGNSRESSIHYQSARKDALAFVDILVRSNAIKLPVKEAARLKALEAITDRYVAGFFEDIGSFGAVARANGTDTPEEATVSDEDEE